MGVDEMGGHPSKVSDNMVPLTRTSNLDYTWGWVIGTAQVLPYMATDRAQYLSAT